MKILSRKSIIILVAILTLAGVYLFIACKGSNKEVFFNLDTVSRIDSTTLQSIEDSTFIRQHLLFVLSQPILVTSAEDQLTERITADILLGSFRESYSSSSKTSIQSERDFVSLINTICRDKYGFEIKSLVGSNLKSTIVKIKKKPLLAIFSSLNSIEIHGNISVKGEDICITLIAYKNHGNKGYLLGDREDVYNILDVKSFEKDIYK